MDDHSERVTVSGRLYIVHRSAVVGCTLHRMCTTTNQRINVNVNHEGLSAVGLASELRPRATQPRSILLPRSLTSGLKALHLVHTTPRTSGLLRRRRQQSRFACLSGHVYFLWAPRDCAKNRTIPLPRDLTASQLPSTTHMPSLPRSESLDPVTSVIQTPVLTEP